jgi:NADH-quinone oxidoreductase subunit N
MTTETFLILAPEIVLASAAVLIYLLSLWISKPAAWRWMAMAAILVASFLWGLAPEHVSHLAQREVQSDSIAQYFRALLLVASFLLLLCLWQPLAPRGDAEHIATLLLGLVGAMLAVGAKDLVLLFVGLELLSVSTYVLLYTGKMDHAGREAALKYFLLSVLSSALLLYGLSFLYGIGGSTDFAEIATRIRSHLHPAGSAHLVVSVALVLIGLGLGFKAAAAPFHFYAPDVYAGTGYPSAAFLSVLPKLTALVIFLRIAGIVYPATFAPSWQLLAILAAISMTVGNLGALLQQDLRRLLAYSSIAHAGYMLLGLAAYTAARGAIGGSRLWGLDGAAAFGLYALVYFLATLGIFAGILALRRNGSEIRQVSDLAGAAWSGDLQVRLVAWAIVICLVSLAGVPPLAGFWGKLLVFGSALSIPPAEAEAFGIFVGLVILAAVNTAIGAAYYLRVVGSLVFASYGEGIESSRMAGPPVASILAALMIIWIGLWWQPWARWSHAASPIGSSSMAVTPFSAGDSSPMTKKLACLVGSTRSVPLNFPRTD